MKEIDRHIDLAREISGQDFEFFFSPSKQNLLLIGLFIFEKERFSISLEFLK